MCTYDRNLTHTGCIVLKQKYRCIDWLYYQNSNQKHVLCAAGRTWTCQLCGRAVHDSSTPPPSPIKTYPFDLLMTLKFICTILFEGARGRTLPILPPVKEALLMQKSKETTLDNACLDHHRAIALKCNAEGGHPFTQQCLE